MARSRISTVSACKGKVGTVSTVGQEVRYYLFISISSFHAASLYLPFSDFIYRRILNFKHSPTYDCYCCCCCCCCCLLRSSYHTYQGSWPQQTVHATDTVTWYIMISSLNRDYHLFPIFSAYILFTAQTFALPANLWVVEIDNGPSPSPEDGPPLSRGALRDTGYLPIQVGSIIGAYLVWTIFISIAVLTVGRRLRRQAQAPNSQRSEVINSSALSLPIPQSGIDMKATSHGGVWEVTPISPTTDVPWSLKSWGSMKKHSRSAGGSVVTFNESIISEDRAKNEFEMDRLYAAVADHEARRQKPVASPPIPQTLPMSPLNQNPPELQHLRFSGKQSFHDSGLLPSPPPEHDLERSPTSPISNKSPFKRFQKPPPLNFSDPSRNSSRSSFASFGKRKTPSIRGLPISPPMGSPDIVAHSQYLESTPLSPRYYNPGPPPPTPPSQYKPYQEQLASPLPIDEDGRKYFFSPTIRSSRASMSTQGYSPGPTPRTATFPIYPPPTVQEEQQAAQQSQLGSFTIPITINPSSAAPTPRVVPSTPLPSSQFPTDSQQQSSYPQNYSVPRITSISPPARTGTASSESSTTPTRRAPKPAPLFLSNTSQTTLSLRTAPLPLRALRSPNSTRPISTIRNTELNRPDASTGSKPNGTAGGLRVPGTAGMTVPATPYSPFYMPMTPLTPVTPGRLVTREERKRSKKEEGRRVLTQDDMVVAEDDMWGEGY